MNTKQLKYVQVLAREGSFSQAAECLNISQPSLSQYIKKIEKETGVVLFDRAGGRIRLTDAGRIYLEAGSRILDLEQQMENQFSDLAGYKYGKIRIGISPHRSVWFMPTIVSRFRKLFPGIQIILEEKVGQELLQAAEDGEFDLCVTTLPVNEKIFEYEHILKEEVVLAVAAESELDNRLSVSARQGNIYPQVDFQSLNGTDFIMLGENQLMQRILRKMCQDQDVVLKTAVECRSIEAQIAMVEAGVGAALVPSGIARVSMAKGIRYYSVKETEADRDIVVAYRKDQYLSKPMIELKNIMKNVGN